jgi:ribosomal protein S18 acetylase RimI-like enzyme
MVKQVLDAQQFLDLTGEFLYAKEVQNGLMLGLTEELTKQSSQAFKPIFLNAVNFANKTAGAFVQTRSQNGIITDCGSIAVNEIVQFLIQNKIAINGIVGPTQSATLFKDQVIENLGGIFEKAMDHKILRLDSVIWPPDCEGRPMVATDQDFELVFDWLGKFMQEASPLEVFDQEYWRTKLRDRIRKKEIYLWKHQGQFVSCCQVGQSTKNGIRISFVYTPNDCRGKGFASNLVAFVSQDQLNRGFQFCSLYTNADNPTSNKIYQQIGYNIVTDSVFYIFKNKD